MIYTKKRERPSSWRYIFHIFSPLHQSDTWFYFFQWPVRMDCWRFPEVMGRGSFFLEEYLGAGFKFWCHPLFLWNYLSFVHFNNLLFFLWSQYSSKPGHYRILSFDGLTDFFLISSNWTSLLWYYRIYIHTYIYIIYIYHSTTYATYATYLEV